MRDLLTEEEIRELLAPHLPGGAVSSQAMRIMLQAAARLGAERERERAAKAAVERQAEVDAVERGCEGG